MILRFIFRLSGLSCAFCATICALTCALATLRANNATIAKYAIATAVYAAGAGFAFSAAKRRRST